MSGGRHAAAYAAVVCRGTPEAPGFGNVDLDYDEYMRQMARPNAGWECPRCGEPSDFDDARFEELNDLSTGEDDDVPAF